MAPLLLKSARNVSKLPKRVQVALWLTCAAWTPALAIGVCGRASSARRGCDDHDSARREAVRHSETPPNRGRGGTKETDLPNWERSILFRLLTPVHAHPHSVKRPRSSSKSPSSPPDRFVLPRHDEAASPFPPDGEAPALQALVTAALNAAAHSAKTFLHPLPPVGGGQIVLQWCYEGQMWPPLALPLSSTCADLCLALRARLLGAGLVSDGTPIHVIAHLQGQRYLIDGTARLPAAAAGLLDPNCLLEATTGQTTTNWRR